MTPTDEILAETKQDSIRSLMQAVIIGGVENSVSFLQDVLTPSEIDVLNTRLKIATFKKSGKTWRQIQNSTGASRSMIMRVTKTIKNGCGGYDRIFDKIQSTPKKVKNMNKITQLDKYLGQHVELMSQPFRDYLFFVNKYNQYTYAEISWADMEQGDGHWQIDQVVVVDNYNKLNYIVDQLGKAKLKVTYISYQFESICEVLGINRLKSTINYLTK